MAALRSAGLLGRVADLPFGECDYDPGTDGPRVVGTESGWLVARGYDGSNSFFEVGDSGLSTRGVVFLVTPSGFLELAAYGVVGWNRNPEYVLRGKGGAFPAPPSGLSGMGFGLERLLLADQVLARSGSAGKR